MALRDDASGCCVAAITSVLFLSFSFFLGFFFVSGVGSFLLFLIAFYWLVRCLSTEGFHDELTFLVCAALLRSFSFLLLLFFFGPENGRTRFSTPVRGKLFGNGRRASIFEAGHSVGP